MAGASNRHCNYLSLYKVWSRSTLRLHTWSASHEPLSWIWQPPVYHICILLEFSFNLLPSIHPFTSRHQFSTQAMLPDSSRKEIYSWGSSCDAIKYNVKPPSPATSINYSVHIVLNLTLVSGPINACKISASPVSKLANLGFRWLKNLADKCPVAFIFLCTIFKIICRASSVYIICASFIVNNFEWL